MIVKLLDGSSLEVENGASVKDVALKISEGLARNALAGEVNGELVLCKILHRFIGDLCEYYTLFVI